MPSWTRIHRVVGGDGLGGNHGRPGRQPPVLHQAQVDEVGLEIPLDGGLRLGQDLGGGQMLPDAQARVPRHGAQAVVLGLAARRSRSASSAWALTERATSRTSAEPVSAARALRYPAVSCRTATVRARSGRVIVHTVLTDPASTSSRAMPSAVALQARPVRSACALLSVSWPNWRPTCSWNS